jgi:hydroxyacylglutathione hydrolase
MSSSPSPIGVAVFPVTPLQQNCTLVWCRKTMKAAIIDPGASVDGLLGAVAKQGLTLDAIWITHGHLDHAGGAAEMAGKVRCWISSAHIRTTNSGSTASRRKARCTGSRRRAASSRRGGWTTAMN